MTSWGLRGVDAALGGGLALGTVVCVLEDAVSGYHGALARYVVAQGVVHGHAVAICTFDEAGLGGLPGVVGAGVADGEREDDAGDQGLSIAWRYRRQVERAVGAANATGSGEVFVSDFDLSTAGAIAPDAPVSKLGLGVSASLVEVLEQIVAHLAMSKKRALVSRVVVMGLSASLFPAGEFGRAGKRERDPVLLFLNRLRAVAREYSAVVVVTCPRDVPLRHLTVAADAVLRLDSFEGRGAGAAGLGREWLGVMVVEKSYRFGVGRVLPGMGDVWVFKRGRRKYVMERATAAPELVEDADAPPDTVDSLVSTEKGVPNGGYAGRTQRFSDSGACGTGPRAAQYEF